MKRIISLCLCASVFNLNALPIHWDVELAAQPPQVFTLQRPRGETYELEAVLKNRGKPFEPAITNACIYWQTNGMENLYWSAPASVSNNFLRASWLPSMDPGATTVRGYIGDPGHIYAAAFQLRFIGSPGPDPVSIDLPVKVLDFATVEVLHPPYYTKAEADGLLEDYVPWANAAHNAVTIGSRASGSAIGDNSLAQGNNVQATGASTHAEGEHTISEGFYTHAEGCYTHAEGIHTHAEGYSTHAEGEYTHAEGHYAHAEGHTTHAEGYETLARGRHTHAEGGLTLAGKSDGNYGRYAHAAGFNAFATNVTAFTWNGSAKDNPSNVKGSENYTPPYGDHGPGTYNINPFGGLYGFWIGESNLGSVLDGIEAMPNNGVMLTNGVLKTKGGTVITAGNVGAASSEDVQTLNLGYQRLYSFSTGATNANISVTNYPPTAAEAEGRTHYDPNDPDLDFSTVPASMRLDEKRDGEKRTVVDTRDWPVWYFGCKLPRILAAAQEYAHTAYTNALAHLSAWADRTARGLENPAGESTLVIDVPNIWLMTDQTFEKHVSGSSSCWVIRSKNAAISPNVTTNGFLELTDAFGTPYIRFNKTEATFADPPASGIYHDDQEDEWIITYETTTKPKGGANLALQGSETYPGKAILKEEGDELCPAVITWTGSSGHWLMHAKPKQIAGADPGKMFFGAVVEVEGQDYIEYLKPVSFSHLVMPNGKKIAPDVPASASVGTVVNWKVVQ